MRAGLFRGVVRRRRRLQAGAEQWKLAKEWTSKQTMASRAIRFLFPVQRQRREMFQSQPKQLRQVAGEARAGHCGGYLGRPVPRHPTTAAAHSGGLDATRLAPNPTDRTLKSTRLNCQEKRAKVCKCREEMLLSAWITKLGEIRKIKMHWSTLRRVRYTRWKGWDQEHPQSGRFSDPDTVRPTGRYTPSLPTPLPFPPCWIFEAVDTCYVMFVS